MRGAGVLHRKGRLPGEWLTVSGMGPARRQAVPVGFASIQVSKDQKYMINVLGPGRLPPMTKIQAALLLLPLLRLHKHYYCYFDITQTLLLLLQWLLLTAVQPRSYPLYQALLSNRSELFFSSLCVCEHTAER